MLREEIERYIINGVSEDQNSEYFCRPLVGFSSAFDHRYAELKSIIGEHHMLPQDMLPQVKSIVSFFVPFERFIVESNRREKEVSKQWALAYIYCNAMINRVSQGLTDFLGQKGVAADYVRATHTYDPATFKAAWSHRSSAFIAGLGTFGRNRLLITEKGCAGRFGTLFVGAELAPGSAEQKERCLHKAGKSCNYCIDICPSGALTDGAIDRHRCNQFLLKTDERFDELETCDVCGKCAMGPCARFD